MRAAMRLLMFAVLLNAAAAGLQYVKGNYPTAIGCASVGLVLLALWFGLSLADEAKRAGQEADK